MSSKSRTKGADFERLIANQIKELTGKDCKRNLEQYREGCHYDLVGEAVNHLAIECKRYAKMTPSNLRNWQEQCLKNANGNIPVLVYKIDYQPIVVLAYDGQDWQQTSLEELLKTA
jgi:hypothetical protein|nr:MAG TPA: HOLLIDAY JUNCTION RESOLVASE HOMOLOGOUS RECOMBINATION [Caudoviricetes sp.]